MPSKTANIKKARNTPRTVLFVVYPQVKLLDVAGSLQVFSDAVDATGKAAYRTALVSLGGETIETDTTLTMSTDSMASWSRRRIDTLIVVGGTGVYGMSQNERFVRVFSQLATKANRVASICTGAFILAACGLLDGRRATTHWESCDNLLEKYPAVQVEMDSIFVKDEHIWSSAGVTAGIDMALAMVSEDLGRSASLALARSLVAYVVRPGGQSQFSTALGRQVADEAGRFDELHQWMANNLDKDLRVENLASRTNMSARNFARVYTSGTGLSPAKAVESMRIEAARRLLEQSDISVIMVAHRCGFGDDERMRRSFIRLLKVTPSAYRRRFQSQNDGLSKEEPGKSQ